MRTAMHEAPTNSRVSAYPIATNCLAFEFLSCKASCKLAI